MNPSSFTRSPPPLPVAGGRAALQRRYGPKSVAEWQLVRRHLELEGGMAFITVLVPEPAAAEICRDELAGWLAGDGKRLAILPLDRPATLATLSYLLATFPLTPDLGALWISAGIVSEADPEYSAWRRAWWEAASRVNERRDLYRRRFSVPLFFVGSPWLQPLFREAAPDFWSTRGFVVRIERGLDIPFQERLLDPTAALATPGDLEPEMCGLDGPDPEFALQEAAKLSVKSDKPWLRAELHLRAGRGFMQRAKPERAEACFREALSLQELAGDNPARRGVTTHELGRAVRDQSRLGEAEKLFSTAFELKKAGASDPIDLGFTLHELGRTLLARGSTSQAESVLKEALDFQRQGKDSPARLGRTTHYLGCALLAQGRDAEAEQQFESALILKTQGADAAISLGITQHGLARAKLDQGYAKAAEQLFREALRLKALGGATAVSLGVTTHELARAVRDQGRLAEAEALFREAQELQVSGGDSIANRGVTLENLAQTIADQGRAEEAAQVQAQAESLKPTVP